jgi:predicted Zn-dependent peptidase
VSISRAALPAPGPPRPFRFPSIERSAGPNGLAVWTVEHTAIPVVTILLLVRRGSAQDPSGREGLAALTVDMLDEGSLGRSAIDMHEALARLGAQLDADIGPDAAVLTVTVLSRFAGEALRLLADMAVRPSILAADFARVRQLRLHRLAQLRDMPGAVADRAFVKLLYGSHPYGHTPLGTEQALVAMTLEDVRGFHAEAIRPDASTLVVVGDCDHEEVRRLAADAFAEWTPGGRPAAVAALPLDQLARLNVVPRAGAPQSELRLGHLSVARNTPDYHALVAANTVLGGQFVSRINLNLREDKGLTYGARTSFDFRRLPGPFILQASVATNGTARAIEESIAEVAAIRGSRPVTPDELSMGVAALTRGYARNFETAEQVARAVSQIALYDLSDDYFAEFVPALERVTADEVTRVAARHLDPDRLTTLIVGDMETISGDLARLNLGDPTICSAETF